MYDSVQMYAMLSMTQTFACIHCMYTLSACETVVLTCFAVAFDCRSLSVGVQSCDGDRIGMVWDQVVQEGVVNVPWNQDLFGEETQGSKNKIHRPHQHHHHDSHSRDVCAFKWASSCITWRFGSDNVHNDLSAHPTSSYLPEPKISSNTNKVLGGSTPNTSFIQ